MLKINTIPYVNRRSKKEINFWRLWRIPTYFYYSNGRNVDILKPIVGWIAQKDDNIFGHKKILCVFAWLDSEWMWQIEMRQRRISFWTFLLSNIWQSYETAIIWLIAQNLRAPSRRILLSLRSDFCGMLLQKGVWPKFWKCQESTQ